MKYPLIRIGVSTLHFRSHLMLAIALCCAGFLVLAYIALTGNTRSLNEEGEISKFYRKGLNFSYPHTKGERVEGGGIRYTLCCYHLFNNSSP